jgi:hypothetical protein
MVKSTKPVKTFSEKRQEQYEKDRFKLEDGVKFVITKIVDIKELTDFSVVLMDGISITGEPVKYYASGKAIVNQCKELLSDAAPDGTLNEPIEVEVVMRKAVKSKYTYPSFKVDVSTS